MNYIVNVHINGQIKKKTVEAGKNLLSFLRENYFDINAHCGGKGTCGKCKVKAMGLINEVSEKERVLLGEKLLSSGLRLACYNEINSDIDIYLSDTKQQAKIITHGKERSVKFDPLLVKKCVTLSEPDISDQLSDQDRVTALMGKKTKFASIDFLRELPSILRQQNFKITLGYYGKEIIFIEPGDTTQKIYGIALDIGTTTIAAYLIDLISGEKIDVYSMLNPQRKFGLDVLSRIDYTLISKASQDEMNEVIISCLNEIVDEFCKRISISNKDIYAAVIVGNTTMMHFLMNLQAANIAVSPFIPVTTQMHKCDAKDIGININSFGIAIIFPSVSAYIGADTVAAVLSSGMYASKKITLLIDIGTNGEIVLGNNEWLYSCSAAAGPAFEGANIRNGIGGVNGAMDSIDLNNGINYSTIGNEKATGICGSGIVDAIAAMLSVGIIDETGRIINEDEIKECDVSSPLGLLKDRIVKIEGMNSLLLIKAEDNDAGVDIAITQKDVRELQNAKAAIAAGVIVLIKQAGINMEDIEKVYLAGGFGSYLRIESALMIGLIPSKLKGKIESIGNAAGSGAIEGLLSKKMIKKANIIKNHMKYIELSGRADFVEEYVECMMFET